MQRLRIVWGLSLSILWSMGATAGPDYHGPNFSIVNDVTATAGQEIVVPVQALDVDDDVPAHRYDIDGHGDWDYDFARQAFVWTLDESNAIPKHLRIKAIADGDNWGYQYFWLDFGEPNYHPEVVLDQDPLPVAVGQLFQYQVSASDYNPNDNISYSLYRQPDGMSIDSETGLISWTPQIGDVLDVDFQVVALDGNSARGVKYLRLESANGKYFPELEPIPTQTLVVGETFSYQFAVRQNGSEGDVSFGIQDLPDGFILNRDEGIVEWTPEEGQQGYYRFKLDFGNDFGAHTTYFSLIVGTLDTLPPPIVHSELLEEAHVGELFQFQVQAETLKSNQTLTYTLSGGPEGATLDENGLFSWTPGSQQNGVHRFKIVVRDSDNAVGQQRYIVSVSGGNFLPEIQTKNLPKYTPGETYSPTIQAVDKNTSEELYYSLDCQPDGATIDASTGQINWQPGSNVRGEQVFCVSVADSNYGKTRQVYYVYLDKPNTPPRITPEKWPTLSVGQAFSYQIKVTDPDEGDEIEYELYFESDGMAIDDNGLFTWTPASDQLGWHRVKVAVNNPYPISQTDLRYFYVLVSGEDQVNTPPEIVSAPVTAILESTPYRYDVGAMDFENDQLTYAIFADDSLNIDPSTGVVQGSLPSRYIDNDLVSNNFCFVNSSSGDLDPQAEDVVIVGLPDLVVANPVFEETSAVVSATVKNRGRSDFDGEFVVEFVQRISGSDDVVIGSESVSALAIGDEVIVSVNVGDVSAFTGELVVRLETQNAPECVTVNNQTIAAIVNVQVSDTSGASDGQKFIVTVVNENDAPIVTSSDSAEIDEGFSSDLQVVATDQDRGDVLGYELAGAPTGVVIDAQTGLINISELRTGNYTFNVIVTDLSGVSIEYEHTLVVSPAPNQPPVITSDEVIAALEGTAYYYDVDASDPNIFDILEFSVVGPAGMGIDAATGVIHWEPSYQQAGDHSVSVTVSDNNGGTYTQDFVISVANNNRAPNIESISTTAAQEGQAYTSVVTATDPDGDPITFNVSTTLSGLEISDAGVITWLPDFESQGDHSVSVDVSDGSDVFTHTFILSVANTNRVPVINSKAPQAVVQGDAWVYVLDATDPDGDTISVTVDPSENVSIDPNTHEISWNTANVDTGSHTVSVTVSDSEGGAVEESASVSVLPASTVSTYEGKDFWLSISNNWDNNADSKLTLYLVSPHENASATVSIPLLDTLESIQLTQGQVATLEISLSDMAAAGGAMLNQLVANAAVHIESDANIVVYGINQRPYSTDGYSVIPTDSLGTEYIIGQFGTSIRNQDSQSPIVDIVATEDNTVVHIDAVMDLFIGAAGSEVRIPKGAIHTFAMNKGDVFKLQAKSSARADLSGTSITSNNNIAVFSTHSSVAVAFAWADMVIEQMPPIDALGTQYFSSPFYATKGDTYRIIATEDDTEVSANGVMLARLNAGETFNFISREAQFVKANNPFMFLHFMSSASYTSDSSVQPVPSLDYGQGDPSMLLLGSVENYLDSYTVSSPQTDLELNFINVVISDSAASSLLIDGAVIDSAVFVPIGETGYSYSQIEIQPGSHRVTADEPFGLVVYGYDDQDSYAYSGGMALGRTDLVSAINITSVDSESNMGEQACISATVLDATGRGLPAIPVKFDISSTHSLVSHQMSNSSGEATHCYLGYELGSDQVTVSVNDVASTATLNWNAPVEGTNFAPIITSKPSLSFIKDQAYSYQVEALDLNGDALTYELTATNTSIAMSENGLITWDASSFPYRYISWWRAGQSEDVANKRIAAVPIDVEVTITDSIGNQTVQKFQLNEYLAFNTNPRYEVENPNPTAVVGIRYIYDPEYLVSNSNNWGYRLHVTDYDGDKIYTSLVNGPTGASLSYVCNELLGIQVGDPSCADLQRWIEWTPATPGTETFEFEISDSRGSPVLTQQFDVEVLDNVPVSLNSDPCEGQYSVVVGGDFLCLLDINNDIPMTLRSNLDNVRIVFEQRPTYLRDSWVQIGDGTASIQLAWTPSAANLGDHLVRFYLEDQVSRTETFEFTISVTDDNQPPSFDRYSLTLNTEASIPLSYQLNAIDPDGDQLEYGAVSLPSGMNVSNEGFVTWTPALDLSQSTHNAIFSVSDGKGGYDYLPTTIYVSVLINQAPHFVSDYFPRTAKVGVPYEASFAAVDREGSPVTYLLSSHIPTAGEATLTPDASYSVVPNAVGTFNVGVRASDGELYRWKQGNIQVLDPTDPANQLVATIAVSPRVIDPDETVVVSVNPTNVASTPQVTYSAGATSFPTTTDLAMDISGADLSVGENTLTAVVTDGYETVQVSTSVYVSDPADETPPELTIHTPEFNSVVTAPTDIVVSATDNIVEYVVSYRRTDSNTDVEIARGEAMGDIVEQSVATFDPTLLVNGTYLIIFQATDANGVTSIVANSVIVEGQLKVGHFSMTVEDLMIPLEGIPIRLTRTYDSRRKNEQLDFGYGWYPDYQAIRLEENDEPTKGWTVDTINNDRFRIVAEGGFQEYSGLGTCSRSNFDKTVTITLPNGKIEKFAAKARFVAGTAVSINDPDCYLLGEPDYHVHLEFVPLGNTESVLTTPEGNLHLEPGGYLAFGEGEFEPAIIRNYVLTTKSGYTYYINQDTGIQRIVDNNGNEITYTNDGISHSNGKSITFERDAQGRIEFVRAPGDISIQYHYDANGDLVAVSDPVAYKTQEQDDTRYTYYTDHYLDEIFDALDRKALKNLYDDAGRLYGQEHPDETVKVFDHRIDDRTSIVTDLDGRTTIFNYDDRGNVLEEIKVMSNNSNIVTTFTYDANDNQETKTIGASVWTTSYDSDNNLQYAQDPEGNRVRYEDYNARGQETKIYDELNRLTEMNYDVAGNLQSINMPLLTDADSNTQVAHSASNVIENGRVTSTTDLRGHTTTYTYYPAGHQWVGQKWTETTDESGTVTYTYDDNNNVKSETRERTVNGTVISETVSYDYDDNNRVIKTTYPDTTFTETIYDAAGNMDRERDRFGVWTDYTYDVFGRLRFTEYADDTNEVRTYSREGLLESVTDRAGRTTSYEYDHAGRLSQTIFHDGSFTETQYTPQGWVQYEWDEERNLTEYVYDLAGRRTDVIRHIGNEQITRSYTYYDNGELHTETDALNQTTTYVINEFDQRIETQFHNGTTIGQRYDPMGARIRQIDQNSIGTDYRYDDLGRLHQVQPDVEIENVRVPNTTYTYDEVGNKLTQTDAEGRTTTWTYDYFGRVLTRQLPLGQMESFVYDDVNRTITHTDFNGDYSITQSDVMGRVESMSYFLADGTPRASESYTYYNNDQVHTVTDKHGVTEYGYDARDRLEWLIQPDNVRFDYGYDLVGNRTQVKVTRGTEETVVDYTYDDLNRLETVTDVNGTTTYAYYDNGNLHAVTYPNGVVTEYQYNAVNQLEVLTTRDAQDNILTSYTYGLDNTGRRETITEQDGRFTQYGYDDLYRLTSENITDATNGDYSASYQYDWIGNRLTETIDSETTIYAYDDNDRLEQQGGTVFAYDDNGNTLTETLDGVVTTYSYDEKNLLTSVEKGSVITDYTYNHNGIRTSKTESGITTDFIVDENRDYAQVLQEVESDSVKVHYTYGHDLINQERAGIESYYLYDGLGSTRALADSAGEITDTYFYEAFGDVLAETGDTENDYKYTGEQYDSSLDMTYLRARYYDQGVGRFTQMDTWAGVNAQPITLNKYLYANADPVTYVDPTGNFSIGSLMSATNIRGILTTTAVQSVVTASGVAARFVVNSSLRLVHRFAAQAYKLANGAGKKVYNVSSAVSRAVKAFRSFTKSNKFKNSGDANHFMDLSGPSLKTKSRQIETPYFKVWKKLQAKFILGGKAGRLFELQYKIGSKGNPARGTGFVFRVDLYDYVGGQGTFKPHYHLGYEGKSGKEHHYF